MGVFRCSRVPDGPVRTAAGVVEFRGGLVEVVDAELAAALREVPDVFGITEDEPPHPPPADPEPDDGPESDDAPDPEPEPEPDPPSRPARSRKR